jgi:hypothetical protein
MVLMFSNKVYNLETIDAKLIKYAERLIDKMIGGLLRTPNNLY